MIKNYGLIKPEIEEKDWKLGAVGDFPYTLYQPNGDWTKYLPNTEKQDIKFETWNCTAFGTTNIKETLLNRIEGKEYNLSDRYIGVMAGTGKGGNTVQKVAETIRKERSCNEKTMPWGGDDVDEYYSWKGVDKKAAITEAHEFPYELQHTYLWTWKDNLTQEQKLERLKEGLKYSPVGVSVTAWSKKDGLYIDRGRENTHWTMLYKIDDLRQIFDSYEPYKKTLHPDHNIEYAKIYALVKKPSVQPLYVRVVEILTQIVKLLTEPKKKEMTKQERLLQLAQSKKGTDFTDDRIVADRVSCAFAVAALLKEIDPETPDPVSLAWTPNLDKYLATSPKFRRVPDPVGEIKPGSIVVSPTSKTKTGHAGIYEDSWRIMANNSLNGLWLSEFNRSTWRNYYYPLPIRIYELV